MSDPAADSAGEITFVDLEFDTAANHGAPLGDIAASLVAIHDLLRDLATVADADSGPRYRDIRVVNIEMRSPLTITLELRAISDEAVRAFQELGRAVILFRDRREHRDAAGADCDDATANRHAAIAAATRLLCNAGFNAATSAQEVERLHDQLLTLQNAEVALQRVIIRHNQAASDAS